MIMLSGINVFKSTLFFLVWAEVLLHLEHDMKFTSGKSSLQTHFGRPGNKNLPSLCYSILCSSFTRSNTQIYRVNFFLQEEAICISKQLININLCLVIINVFFLSENVKELSL